MRSCRMGWSLEEKVAKKVTGVNKTELISRMAKSSGISKAKAATAFESLFMNIETALKKKQRVAIAGFGTFGVSKRKARLGRNPHTGDAIEIKAKMVVRFKGSKILIETLKGTDSTGPRRS
jgi:DNA-binding protein HU-beta